MPPNFSISRRAVLFPAVLLLLLTPGTRAADAPPRAPQQPTASKPSPAPRQPVDFTRDIRPILEQHCYECHSARKTKGSLRLDIRDRALAGGMTGPLLVPRDSEQSLLVRRLLGLDHEDRMPLDEDPLPADQIALIQRWIDEGAAWPESPAAGTTQAASAGHQDEAKHWAYVSPKRPPLPPVQDTKWPRTPIDRFILARLEREGLHPSHEASKEALLRRVTLDLTGLPPTLDEIDAFLADTRPDAYDRVVDRLLASPHYGERWALPWLDLARYADSHGYEKDDLRTMWKYRDWVIDALNRDEPFDQFTIDQIAGDMLPAPTQAQLIATGFHRNTLLNQEGGIDIEEARWETLVDRVGTTGTVWLGTTIACAQCHDHKYDPISQRDFYRMLAFFDNGEYKVHGQQGGDHWIAEPEIDLPTPEQAAARDKLQAELTSLKETLAAGGPDAAAQEAAWERAIAEAGRAWTTLTPVSAHAAHGTTLTVLPDGSVLASGAEPLVETYTVRATMPAGRVTALRLEAMPDPKLPQGGPGRDYYGNFVLTSLSAAISSPSSAGQTQLIFSSVEDNDHVGGSESQQIIEPPAEPKRARDLPPGWSINATRDTTRLPRQAVLLLKAPLDVAEGTSLTVSLDFRGTAVAQALGRFRLSVTGSPDPLTVVSVSPETHAAIAVPPDARSEEQRDLVAKTYRATAPSLKPTRDRIEQLEKQIDALGIVTAQVLRERASFERPSTFFRNRGSYMSKGERVYAGTPEVLPGLPDDAMPNRLGLARWLVSEENPLTARVTVNRAWEAFFGRGIVETSEDFGMQGAPPSHPELLDWLATELVRLKWSMKSLHRLIVTSAAYRQDAAATPELLERDPYNRLIARGPRFRLDAEMIRDVTLAASGLLSSKIGGPSVFPPQPEGIWDNPYSDAKWVTSSGEDRYRRGLYTFIRRTSPYPSLTTFDATSREQCTVRRVRTNTPLQALVTLNDEAFFEAARALAHRMLTEVAPADPSPTLAAERAGGQDDPATASPPASSLDRARAEYGFRLCTSRRPSSEEVDRIVRSYRNELALFRKDPAAAARVLRTQPGAPDAAERAAWTLVTNALLNLDETVSK